MLNLKDNKVNAREIYDYIGVKTPYYKWVRRCIDVAEFKENKDFWTNLSKSTGGRPLTNYYFTIDSAKEMCIISATEKAKELRRWLIQLGTKHETGQLYDRNQINFLLELTKVMGLFSIQSKVENDHFLFHNNKYDWWDYRAKILGYGTNQLRIEVERLNMKYKSMKQALMITDQYELIRVGIIDLFIALGKTPEFAANVADLCKDFAKQMKTPIWDDSPKKNSIPFNLNVDKGLENSIKNNQLKLSK